MYNKLPSMLHSANLPAPWFVLCSGLLSVNKRIVPLQLLFHCANDSDLTELFFLSVEPKVVSREPEGTFLHSTSMRLFPLGKKECISRRMELPKGRMVCFSYLIAVHRDGSSLPGNLHCPVGRISRQA